MATDLLDVLGSSPSTAERAVEELNLRAGLARVLTLVRGETAEVEAAWQQAAELAEGLPGSPEMLPVLRSLASYCMLRSLFTRGIGLAHQMLDVADRHGDEEARIDGQLVLGANLAFIGRFRSGIEQLEQGIAAYESRAQGPRRLRLGNNAGVVCFATSAMVHWMVGYPDRAVARIGQAIDLAEGLDHPSSIAYAHFHAALIHLWRGEPEAVEARTAPVLQVAEEFDFQLWRAVGSCLRGAALAESGSIDEGMALVDAALTSYQRLQSPPVFWPLLLHIQAGVLGSAGRPAEGLALEAEAIDVAGGGEGRMFESECAHRYGELLLAASPDAAEEAEDWFVRAVASAEEMEAPMFRLRAALPLARLWREQGRADDARTLVADCYGAFDEGFDTADLVRARGLLDELA